MERNVAGYFFYSMTFFLFLMDRFSVKIIQKNHLGIVWRKNYLIKLMALVLGCFDGILYESGNIRYNDKELLSVYTIYRTV